MTYTYAILEISQAAYDEIRTKLAEAGYDQAFHTHEGDFTEVIDMHGIGLSTADRKESGRPCGCDPKANWVCERHRERP